jgi:MYXO-CTERM domain-containing protein
VDIVAPGDEFVISATDTEVSYGSGTSYASPVVAGAATQLSSIAHQLSNYFAGSTDANAAVEQQAASDANDGRVIKAILLNSADKLPGWNNGQTMVNGVLTTTQGLDFTMGAGALNVARAADNYLDGQFDPKVVGQSQLGLGPKGWDLSTVSKGVDNLYDLGQITSGTTLTTTLTWFVDRAYNSATQTADEGTFVNLNLDVYEVVAGSDQLIAVSVTPYENVQQLSFVLPDSSDYVIGVDFAGIAYGPAGSAGPTSETYALAWSDAEVDVPEPGMVGVVMLGMVVLRRRRRR